MKHLFKLLILLPWFYFFSWIENANRDSKFFPIFYYFYWFYIPLYALFSLAWTVISVLFFNIVLRNVTDIKLWGIWFLFILLAIGMNRLTYFCFKKMLRLRRELGKSKGGRHWFISVFICRRWLMKIPLLTLARHKFVYVLLTLLFLALVYRDFLMTYFFFDIHAPDLANG